MNNYNNSNHEIFSPPTRQVDKRESSCNECERKQGNVDEQGYPFEYFDMNLHNYIET